MKKQTKNLVIGSFVGIKKANGSIFFKRNRSKYIKKEYDEKQKELLKITRQLLKSLGENLEFDKKITKQKIKWYNNKVKKLTGVKK